MKIGIVGPADRAVAWEEHLRPHRAVEEVVISGSLNGIGNVDACLLFDEADHELDLLLKSVQAGYHSFLVSKLPREYKAIEKIYHAAEEANVLLQFSHWPSLAPASQWMAQKIAKPKFIQIVREVNYTEFLETQSDIEDLWIDELAFCLKWIDGAVHNLDLKTVKLQHSKVHALHLYLRFDSGATSNIYINTTAQQKNHTRFASDKSFVIQCDVQSQTVRLGQENSGKHLFFTKKEFDPTRAAEMAVTQFIKAIQLNKPTLYNGYDLQKLAGEIQKVREKIRRS